MNANSEQRSADPSQKMLEFRWMPPNAPYMPIAAAGLLSVLERAGECAALRWSVEKPEAYRPYLTLNSSHSMEEIANAIIEAEWPDFGAIDWQEKPGQAIKPMLREAENPIRRWRELAKFIGTDGQVTNGGISPETRFLRSLLTDAALDGDGVPGRSRLLRGVKADISGITDYVQVIKAANREEIMRELAEGPVWASGSTGRGLGLVPNLHTFGATTGRNPSGVKGYSPLLYLLCWHGVMAMPPIAVAGRGGAIVGGPLFSAPNMLSWPIWTFDASLQMLVVLFGFSAVHAEEPVQEQLRGRGIAAVFRSQARPISSMLDVFGWGQRVA